MKLLLILFFAISSSYALAQKKDLESQTLENAYQREFEFLLQQKKNLIKRKKDLEKDFKERLDLKQNKINALQVKLTKQSINNEKLIQKIAQIEDDNENVAKKNSLYDFILNQGDLILKPYGYKKNEQEHTFDQRIKNVFNYSVMTLKKLTSVSKSQGDFYLKSGKKVTGEILSIGNIASFGKTQNRVGALVPIGNGEMKLINENAPSFESISDGSKRLLTFYLYESKNTPALILKDNTIFETIKKGGLIGYSILLMGVVAFILLMVRYWILYIKSKIDFSLIRKLKESILKNSDTGDSIQNSFNGPLKRILMITIENNKMPREKLEDLISEEILKESIILEKFGHLILVFASVAPLLGLLGTVTGMISTFQMITEFGAGDPKLLSGGISEALVTTELGLIVAIPTLLLGNLLNNRANNVRLILEQGALSLINAYDKKQLNDLGND